MQDRTRALLFDMDGTLTHSDRLHFHAFNALLESQGRSSFDHQQYNEKILGRANAVIMRDLFPDAPVERHRELADRKEALFREMAGELQPLPGLMRLVDWAVRSDVRIAVVTNAPRANAERMIDVLAVRTFIDVLVIGEELERSKPDPLPYCTAMQQLGVQADDALAFEDSGSGVRSAASAGLYTFGMRTSLDAAQLREAGASAVIDDFESPVLWTELKRRFPGSRPM